PAFSIRSIQRSSAWASIMMMRLNWKLTARTPRFTSHREIIHGWFQPLALSHCRPRYPALVREGTLFGHDGGRREGPEELQEGHERRGRDGTAPPQRRAHDRSAARCGCRACAG